MSIDNSIFKIVYSNFFWYAYLCEHALYSFNVFLNKIVRRLKDLKNRVV